MRAVERRINNLRGETDVLLDRISEMSNMGMLKPISRVVPIASPELPQRSWKERDSQPSSTAYGLLERRVVFRRRRRSASWLPKVSRFSFEVGGTVQRSETGPALGRSVPAALPPIESSAASVAASPLRRLEERCRTSPHESASLR